MAFLYLSACDHRLADGSVHYDFDNISFVKDSHGGYTSVNMYPMQVGEDYYGMSPTGGSEFEENYRLYYADFAQREERNNLIYDTLAPMHRAANDLFGLDYSSALVKCGSGATLDYVLRTSTITFFDPVTGIKLLAKDVYNEGKINRIEMYVRDMNLNESARKKLSQALSEAFIDGTSRFYSVNRMFCIMNSDANATITDDTYFTYEK